MFGTQPFSILSRLLLSVLSLALVLSACTSELDPGPPTNDPARFVFSVDPEAQTVTLSVSESSDLHPQYLPSDTRILVPGVDLALNSYNYVFRGNKLIVQTRFKNITEASSFYQPFFFTLDADTQDIQSATAPLVTDKDLGGGVLSPGERTSRLTFEVVHKNKPFTFLVDASAAVITETKLVPDSTAPGDGFGRRVAASEQTLAVAAKANGNRVEFGDLYVFERSGDWEQTDKISGNVEFLEYNLSLAAGDDVIVVGDPSVPSGNVFVYEPQTDGWERVATLNSDEGDFDFFGQSVGVRGGTVFVGSPEVYDTGSVYVFEKQGGTWEKVANLTPSSLSTRCESNVGTSLAVAQNLLVFTNTLTSMFDECVSYNDVYVFEEQDGSWQEVAKLTPAEGSGIGQVATDGNTIVLRGVLVGADSSSSSGYHVFEETGGSWTKVMTLAVPGGGEVALSGNTLIVGAPGDDGAGTDAGAVYVFTRQGGSWQRAFTLSASDGAAGDRFGSSLALNSGTAFIGAPGDDDNGADAGSVYLYALP